MHCTNAVPSRVDITFWITSSWPQANVALHLIDIGSHSGCLEDVVNVLRTAVCAASCKCRWTPVPATPLDGARHCCDRKCRPLDSGPSDDRRSKIQSLKDFGVGSQGLRGVQSTRNPLSSSRSACCRLCPAVMDGLLKRLSVSVRCLFCKSVFGTCAHGLLRKEHLLSPLTSRVVCLPLHVPDVEHLGNIFQPHFEVGGGSRHTVLLTKKRPHRVRRAPHLLAHPRGFGDGFCCLLHCG